MRQNPLYTIIDDKFLDAVDEIKRINTKLGIKPNKDSAIGRLIYPSNRSIISSVRSQAKHIPHIAIINFAKEFNVDMNYFYDSMTSLQYQPRIENTTTVSGNGIYSSGSHARNTHAGQSKTKHLVTECIPQQHPVMPTILANPLIANFMNTLSAEQMPEFVSIITQIQKEYQTKVSKLNHKVEQGLLDLKELRGVCDQDLKHSRDDLKQAREKLDKALESEISLLKQLLLSK